MRKTETESIKRKKEASKRKNNEKVEVQRRKTVKRTKTDKLSTLGTENKENNITKHTCNQCEVILNSDTDEDEDKNVGCDFCTKWYHLKCTNFIGLSYDEVKDKAFKCNSCILEED